VINRPGESSAKGAMAKPDNRRRNFSLFRFSFFLPFSVTQRNSSQLRSMLPLYAQRERYSIRGGPSASLSRLRKINACESIGSFIVSEGRSETPLLFGKYGRRNSDHAIMNQQRDH